MAKHEATTPLPPAWTRTDLAHDPHFAPDKARRVQRMFASIARRYDLNNRLHSFGRDQSWRRRVVALAGPAAGETVLDAACGTGDLSLLFAQVGAKQVVGVDFTDAMLAIARDKASALANRGRIDPARMEFAYADVTHLPFPDQSFDIVSIGFGLRNVERPDLALREFHRVLRPDGGRLLILEFSRPRNSLVRAVNHIYARRIMPLTASLIARDRSGAYRYLPRSIETFPEGAALEAAVRAAGFTETEQHALTFGICAITIGWV